MPSKIRVNTSNNHRKKIAGPPSDEWEATPKPFESKPLAIQPTVFTKATCGLKRKNKRKWRHRH
jgi:hypothetical protein